MFVLRMTELRKKKHVTTYVICHSPKCWMYERSLYNVHFGARGNLPK